MSTEYTDTLSSAEFIEAAKLHPSNKQSIQQSEKRLDDIEAGVMSDEIILTIADPISGLPIGARKVRMSDSIAAIHNIHAQLKEADAIEAGGDENDDSFLAASEQFEKAVKMIGEISSPSKAPTPPQPSSIPPKTAPTISLESLGLEFLTTPPSLPDKSVKLQLSGPMKFTATITCHASVVSDSLVVLVVDSRVKSEIVDISADGQDIEAALIFEDGEIIDVYLPIMTYDVGVLRHFAFIRKYNSTEEE